MAIAIFKVEKRRQALYLEVCPAYDTGAGTCGCSTNEQGALVEPHPSYEWGLDVEPKDAVREALLLVSDRQIGVVTAKEPLVEPADAALTALVGNTLEAVETLSVLGVVK